MKPRDIGIVLAALLLTACAREPTNSDGNGTGQADGTLGRGDPVTAPANDGRPAGDPSSSESNNPPPQPSQQ